MNQHPKLSIVIRTFNEQKWLPSVLQSLRNQTINYIEIIIVDSGSTDETLQITESFDCKIIKIYQDEFTYPYALNVGIAETSGEIIGILSGHSIPASKDWAVIGLEHFIEHEVAGVTGPIKSLTDASLIEKTHQSLNFMFRSIFPFFIKDSNSVDNRNAMIRRSDWEKYNFDEKLVEGCEDFDWAQYLTRKMNKKIIYDTDFQVKHSHSGIGKSTDIEMWSNWRETRKIIKERYK